MTNQEILDNAPEGATHVLFQSINYIYIKFGVHTQGLMYCNHKKGWRLATHVLYSNLRSLADIKRISELDELVDMLIDCQSADASLIPIMYHAWLHKAKWLKGGAE